MTQINFNTSLNKSSLSWIRKSQVGATLIECLIVLSIMAALVGAISSAMILTFKSYNGEFITEREILEGQRAALELEYYSQRALRIYFSDINNNPTYLANGTPAGYVVQLLQPEGNWVSFAMAPNSPQVGNLQQCTLEIIIGNVPDASGNVQPAKSYIFSTSAIFDTAAIPYPFWSTAIGGLAYSWKIPTPATGDITMGGATFLGL
jgi:hypothetical protein